MKYYFNELLEVPLEVQCMCICVMLSVGFSHYLTK